MIKKSDFRVYDLENYDMNSFELGRGHKCRGTDFASYFKIAPNDRPKIKKVKKLD